MLNDTLLSRRAVTHGNLKKISCNQEVSGIFLIRFLDHTEGSNYYKYDSSFKVPNFFHFKMFIFTYSIVFFNINI